MLIVTFAHWEEGFVMASGNAKLKGRRTWADRHIRLINRERVPAAEHCWIGLLRRGWVCIDLKVTIKSLSDICLPPSRSFPTPGMMQFASLPRSAAQTFRSRLHPDSKSARHDLVMRKRTGDLPAVKVFSECPALGNAPAQAGGACRV